MIACDHHGPDSVHAADIHSDYVVTYPAYNSSESLYADSVRLKEPSSFTAVDGGAVGWLSKKFGVFGTEKRYLCALSDIPVPTRLVLNQSPCLKVLVQA